MPIVKKPSPGILKDRVLSLRDERTAFLSAAYSVFPCAVVLNFAAYLDFNAAFLNVVLANLT